MMLPEQDSGADNAAVAVPAVSSRDALRGAALAGAIIVLAACAYWSPLRQVLDPTDFAAFHRRIDAMGAFAPVGFTLLCVLHIRG